MTSTILDVMTIIVMYIKKNAQAYRWWASQKLGSVKKKITKCIRNIDLKVVQRLAESTIRRIDFVRR
jgi:hypothetical protein